MFAASGELFFKALFFRFAATHRLYTKNTDALPSTPTPAGFDAVPVKSGHIAE